MKRKLSWLILLLLLVIAGNTNTVFAKTTAPKKIKLSKTSLTVHVGETKSLKVKSVTPKKASKKVIWKTSDKRIVTVSKSGKVKGIKQGKATITATSKVSGKKVKCIVVVKKRKKVPAAENQQENKIQNMEDGKMYIKIGEHTLTATMADNSSAQALLEKLKEGDITVDAHDFGNFEKVGDLGFTLPSNNEQITTKAGDLILYQGSNFVLYYDTNSWNFTRLGKVEGVTQKELKQILGKGDVTMVLSLNE